MFSTLSLLEFYLSIKFNDIFGTRFYRWILLQGLYKMNKPSGNSYIVSISNTDLNFYRSFTMHFAHPLPFFLPLSSILIGMFWYGYNKNIQQGLSAG